MDGKNHPAVVQEQTVHTRSVKHDAAAFVDTLLRTDSLRETQHNKTLEIIKISTYCIHMHSVNTHHSAISLALYIFFIFLFLSKYIINDLDIEMSVLLLYHKYFLIIIILTIILPHLSGHLDDNTQAVGSKFPLSCLQNSRKVIWIWKCHHHHLMWIKLVSNFE